MKLLLDENLPKRLKLDLSEHEVFSIRDKGWNGKQNGELLKLMIQDKFDALITFDKKLQYQQNFKKFSIPVIVLNARSNSYQSLKGLVSKIKKALNVDLRPGGIEIK